MIALKPLNEVDFSLLKEGSVVLSVFKADNRHEYHIVRKDDVLCFKGGNRRHRYRKETLFCNNSEFWFYILT